MNSLPLSNDQAVSRLRLVVASRERFWRLALVSIASSLDGMEVLARARDFPRLHAATLEHVPDAIVLDLPLEGLENPVQLLELRKSQPQLGFVLLVRRNENIRTLRFLASYHGVALLTLDARKSDLALALRMAATGFLVVCPWLVEHLMRRPTPPTSMSPDPLPSLTLREQIVLECLARGQSEDSIASKLGIGVRTVETQIARAREKLGAADRTHAVALALEAGLIANPNDEPLLDWSELCRTQDQVLQR